MFSSSTVYFLLPFAIVGNFDPTSVFFGAAFWGIITVLVMFLLGKKINNHKKILIAILLLTWFPLLQMGRWAWNPNLIPLWISIGIIFYLRKNLLSFFLSGIFLGLSVHQHYYAIFAIAAFIGIASLKLLLKKEFKQLFSLNLGAFIMLVPFVIFDLRHPPGIFFMGASAQADRLEAVKVAKNILDFIQICKHTFNCDNGF